MADVNYQPVTAENFEQIPDPAQPGAVCRACDYWESLDGSRERTANPSNRSAKLQRLTAGARLGGSYAMVALASDDAATRQGVGYAQFGPISAYPRAQVIRDRYPALPESPPPYVVTCLQVRPELNDREAVAVELLRRVCAELDRRGVVAVEAYPEVVGNSWLPSAGPTSVYRAAGFEQVAGDDRYPVFRIELVGEVGEAAWPADLLAPADDSDDWPLPLPKAPDADAWPPLPKPQVRNPFGDD